MGEATMRNLSPFILQNSLFFRKCFLHPIDTFSTIQLPVLTLSLIHI